MRRKCESIQMSCCDFDRNELNKSVRKIKVDTLEKNKLKSCSNTLPDTWRVRQGLSSDSSHLCSKTFIAGD